MRSYDFGMMTFGALVWVDAFERVTKPTARSHRFHKRQQQFEATVANCFVLL